MDLGQSNFEIWYDHADMPMRRDGRWVDMEDGLAYDSATDYAAIYYGTPARAWPRQHTP